MVVRVKLEGLKITRNKAGHYYVYVRGNPKAILKNFKGDRDALCKRLAEPDMLTVYNAHRNRDLSRIYAEGTLGSLVAWFQTDCPAYEALAPRTKADYDKAFVWLRHGFDCPLELITTPFLYDLRDRCAKEKWPSFAQKMISALSSMFGYALQRKKMVSNPCTGIKRAHKTDPNANREWLPEEFKAAIELAPLAVKVPLMLARYAGLRSQTIVDVTWKQYLDHPLTGKCFRFIARKTKKTNPEAIIPIMPELQHFLASLKVRTPDGKIALRENGSAWTNEMALQTRVSRFLRSMEDKGQMGSGTTLHGLRVSYAAWLSRSGASDKEVAAALGDKSEAMGKHYTRHVQAEAAVVRAFTKLKGEG